MASVTMPTLSSGRGVTTLRPLAPATHKRTRMPKRPARVAMCNDTTGHQALQALERRLKTMRLNPTRPTRPCRPVHLTSLHATSSTSTTATTSSSSPGGESRASESSPAVATTSTKTHSGMTPRRPRFMKPLMASTPATATATATSGVVPPTPSRPAMPNPGFTSPRRPVSASLPSRRRAAPSILKRRRTRSATTRRPKAVARDDFVPDGMIVSLPPLLPTHSLLADAYTQGYDCGVADADMGSNWEVETDTEDNDMALSGSLGGHNVSSDRPSVAVPANFVHDMLASLDDSLEEGGFHDLLRSARNAQANMVSVESPHIPEEVPLNDSPTLILDALTPAGWNAPPRSPTGFGALPSLGLSLDASLTFDFDMPLPTSPTPAPVPPTTL